MQTNPSTITNIFSSRELRKFRALYCSRNQAFTKIIILNTANSVNPITNNINYKVNLYGSMGSMSPQERINLRQQLFFLTENASIKVKIAQFPISQSQKFTEFSSLNTVHSLFKGNCFEIGISLSFSINKSTLLDKQKAIFTALNIFKDKHTRRGSSFNPFLMIFSTIKGSCIPVRYTKSLEYIKTVTTSVSNPYVFINIVHYILYSTIRFNVTKVILKMAR